MWLSPHSCLTLRRSGSGHQPFGLTHLKVCPPSKAPDAAVLVLARVRVVFEASDSGIGQTDACRSSCALVHVPEKGSLQDGLCGAHREGNYSQVEGGQGHPTQRTNSIVALVLEDGWQASVPCSEEQKSQPGVSTRAARLSHGGVGEAVTGQGKSWLSSEEVCLTSLESNIRQASMTRSEGLSGLCLFPCDRLPLGRGRTVIE